ncbi:hypothetical protein [uncultured Ruegeria sp.]|uniref:hypothetical protein n=1 Tax=uncultured Ruegeria sp. TaxID=259304 RepID=UPI0026333A7F|nr:hypothetical protein [uncultured Ruegeria sp.]
MSGAMRRSHLVLTIAGCFGGGSLYGWSGYLPAVRTQFDVNNASASMVFSIALVGFTLGVLVGPVLLALVRPSSRLPVIAGPAAVSLLLAGLSPGFAGFAVAYGVCFGFTSGALYNFAVSQAAASGNPTLLVPVSVAAFGLGGAIFGPLHVWLTDAGWGLWSIAPALTCLGVVTAASLVCRTSGIAMDVSHRMAPAILRPDKSLAIFWVIFASGSCSGLIVLGFAAQFLARSPDGVQVAGLAIFLTALGNTLGRLSSALTTRHFGPDYATAGALTLSILTLAGLVFATSSAMVIGLLFLVALGYGQLAATTPLLVKSRVSEDAFSGAFGWVFTGWGIAGLVGPWAAGWLLDVTGTLQYALVICVVLSTLSLWLVLRLARMKNAEGIC